MDFIFKYSNKFDMKKNNDINTATGFLLVSNPLRKGYDYHLAHQGPKNFGECQECLGYGLALGPTF